MNGKISRNSREATFDVLHDFLLGHSGKTPIFQTISENQTQKIANVLEVKDKVLWFVLFHLTKNKIIGIFPHIEMELEEILKQECRGNQCCNITQKWLSNSHYFNMSAGPVFMSSTSCNREILINWNLLPCNFHLLIPVVCSGATQNNFAQFSAWQPFRSLKNAIVLHFILLNICFYLIENLKDLRVLFMFT